MTTTLTMFRGDGRTWDLTLRRYKNGPPFPLAGCSIRFTAKNQISDPDNVAVIRKTVGSGITVVDADAGTATLTIDAGDTSGLAADVRLVYDVQVTDALGVPKTVQKGLLLIEQDVSQTAP